MIVFEMLTAPPSMEIASPPIMYELEMVLFSMVNRLASRKIPGGVLSAPFRTKSDVEIRPLQFDVQ